MTFDKIELIVRSTITGVETKIDGSKQELVYKGYTMFRKTSKDEVLYARNPAQVCCFDATELTRTDVKDIARSFKNFFRK